MSPLFVYGTLLRGEPNHHLLSTAVYLGPARTVARYTLVDLGGFPALLEGGGTAVEGEVYSVGRATLAQADRLEGHPHFYERVGVQLQHAVDMGGFVSPIPPFGYVLKRAPRGAPVILTGSWRAHIQARRAS